jgi:hypothetical protein
MMRDVMKEQWNSGHAVTSWGGMKLFNKPLQPTAIPPAIHGGG